MPFPATSPPPDHSGPSLKVPRRRGIRVALVGATAAAIAVVGSLMLSSPQESSALSSSATHVSVATPSPTMSGDMPGMDHGGDDMPATTQQDGEAAGSPADRPLAPVLGTFGGGTAAVLLTAGLMRRRDRDRLLAKRAIRAAGRSEK